MIKPVNGKKKQSKMVGIMRIGVLISNVFCVRLRALTCSSCQLMSQSSVTFGCFVSPSESGANLHM
jgi:hypothetical protein